MSTILQLGKQYRQELLDIDSSTSDDLVRAYLQAYAGIVFDLERLTDLIERAVKRGEVVTSNWLYRQAQFKKLLYDIENRLNDFSIDAVSMIERGQSKTVKTANEYSNKMGEVGVLNSPSIGVGVQWVRVPIETLEHLVGTLKDGSPLRSLFDGFGEKASQDARDVLTNAVIRGISPAQTKSALADALGISMDRAATIARTEQLRPANSASLEIYNANSDVVTGWTRLEQLDEKTCAVCIDEHGKIYPLDADFETHPNCRGTTIPNVKGYSRPIQTGQKWFDKQSDDTKIKILGPAKFEAYKNGTISLSDLNKRTYSEKWGGGRQERSLADAIQVSSSKN